MVFSLGGMMRNIPRAILGKDDKAYKKVDNIPEEQ
jgi:hypothetical protein